MNETEGVDKQLDMAALQGSLQTHLFGIEGRLIYLPTVDSTNTFAMQLARQEDTQEGVVVLTDSQTAGKGRQGRHWVDVSGRNVLLSAILRPRFPPYLLVMIASLAVVDAIGKTCALPVSIKWPNDILIGDRKVAGILIETSHTRTGQLIAVMGIGINVNATIAQLLPKLPHQESKLSFQATTLETECGHKVSRELLIAHLLRSLETAYVELQQEAASLPSVDDDAGGVNGAVARSVRSRWRAALSTLGRTVQVRQGDTSISGVAEDVNDQGELLLLDHSGGYVTITWGDVGYPTS